MIERVYIAGPMTNYPGENYAAFEYAWRELAEHGFNPISPNYLECVRSKEILRSMGENLYRHVLPVDIFAISGADAVLALPGWMGSPGSMFENHFAELAQIPWVGPTRKPRHGRWIDQHPTMYDSAVREAVMTGIRQLQEIFLENSSSTRPA